MIGYTIAILVTIGFSAVGVLGDYFLRLSAIGVVYSISMIVLLTAVGALGFRETLSVREIAGLILAIASLRLLTRFA